MPGFCLDFRETPLISTGSVWHAAGISLDLGVLEHDFFVWHATSLDSVSPSFSASRSRLRGLGRRRSVSGPFPLSTMAYSHSM